MRRFIRIFGSIGFAFFLIAGLAVLLTVSTLLESSQGTPFAQRFFYQAGWFDVFLGLFGLNILCSSLSRWPYKKHHTGFLVVHTGILLILAGSFLARYQGVDGQMALYEGESGNRVLLAGHELVLHAPQEEVRIVGLDKPGRLKNLVVFEGAPGEKIRIERVIPDASVREETREGGADDPPNLGIRFTLKSQMAGAKQPLSLFQKHPWNPASSSASMGPATFELKNSAPPAAGEEASEPRLTVTRKDTGESFSWNLVPLPAGELPLGSSGIVLRRLRYLPDARVNEKNELVNISEEPHNPAVEFEAADASGNSEFHTRFELFPDFESLHGRQKKDVFRLSVDLATPASKNAAAKGTGLAFFMKDGRWAYHSRSKNGNSEGFLELHREYPAGWMDFTFTVDELFTKAVIQKDVRPVSADRPGARPAMAVRVSLEKDGRPAASEWVLDGDSATIPTSRGALVLGIRQRAAAVPFKLSLKDFRKVDYPGTSQAQSFESDVVLEDASEGLVIQKTIRMNKPLDHKGYRIFQSSYAQDENGEISVFTVAKNPGIGLIYGGSIVMCLGVILVFYVKPLSSFGKRGLLP